MLRLILASLVYHWRVNLAVACGVAAGTAVLTGALLVGDSMRGSLGNLTLDRLGRVEHALVTEQFFRPELADELAADPQFREHFSEAVPVILLDASIKRQPDGSSEPVRVGGVNLIACDERFWALGRGGPKRAPDTRNLVVLNRPLADRLGIEIGPDDAGAPETPARVMLHLPNLGTVPSGTVLGQKTGTVRGHSLTVREVIPAEGLGRFSLRPNQQLPLNAYVSLELGRWLFRREVKRRDERVNAILVAGRNARSDPREGSEQVVQSLLRPKLIDFGIQVELTPRGYFNVTTERMLLDPVADELMSEALAGDGADVQPALTYLANTIALGEREIPYSTITAVDLTDEPPWGPFLTPEGEPIGPLEEGQIVLNQWAAEDLGAECGDTIRVTYFDPESPHAAMRERTEPFELAAIAALSGPVADEHFTPSVPGVTEKDSIAAWEAPFEPFDPKRIRNPDHPGPGNDEDYWDRYGTTPKAFVSLATGRRLWGSRFGRTTSLRVAPGEGRSVESIEQTLEEKLAPHAPALGFVFQPVKRQGLEASVGATSFSQLFIGFSFFIIAAAVMLVALLFRLGIDGRASQVGLLLAVGLSRRQVARLLAAEGLMIAAVGSALGAAVGIGYARLMLLGLTSWWLPAIGTPFLRFHATAGSVATGYVCGLLAALGAIVWAVWRTRNVAARQLLSGQVGSETPIRGARPPVGRWIVWALIAGAVVLGLAAMGIGEETRAGAFFGAGAMVLVASLVWAWGRLRAGAVGSAVAAGRGNLARLAVRNLARNPGRSTLTIGLVASASFLIASLSAFRIDPTEQTPQRQSGNGGFALVAESDQPIYHDLNAEQGRHKLGFSPEQSRLLEGATVYSLRVKPGEDASCLNLYRPREPRLLGVPSELVERGGFVVHRWGRLSHKMESRNPWLVLHRDLGRDTDGVPLVPALVDADTATYALRLSRRQPTLDVSNHRGETIRLRIQGVLPGSIFQGDLLVPEKALLRHFPDTSGYRYFLVETEPERAEPVQKALDSALEDYGLRTETTGQRLARFLVVQNTYLGTFQSLGGLGLLLGTFGLAAVQLRSVLERRGELALMRATGFGRRALGWLVMLENGLLLTAGLACGVLAALVAVLPHFFSGTASVPWASLTATLLLVLGVGLTASLGAVRAVLRAPLLPALRGE